MRRHAAIQLPTGPAHMIGVEPWKRMSPVKTTRGVGQPRDDVAVRVGGADLFERDRRCPPTSIVVEPVKVSVGPHRLDVVEAERTERVGDEPVAVLAEVERLERVQQRRRDLVHLIGRGVGRDDPESPRSWLP